MQYFTISTRHLDDVANYSRTLMESEIRYWVSPERMTSHNIIYVFRLECTEEAFKDVLKKLRIKMKGVNT